MGCQNSTGQVNDIQAKNSANLVLGYWGLPLRGQPLRYILELANYPYTETKYTLSQATDWFGKDKQELELDFPNLPYLIHGDFSITESSNIANYLIQLTKQYYLQGEGQDKYRVDNIRYVCDELAAKIFSSTLQKEEEKKNQLDTQILPKIKQLQKVLGTQTSFFKKLTLADIYAYTALAYFKKTYSKEYQQFSSDFDPFLKRFEEIPRIKNYHQSQRYKKL
ncbi:glutathione S-transferase, amine-terminal domain protein (macronuclear) [Tetrahymena thermophila SB210]|uniref:glutathione transferase n=1 Tax=Tetrahymena thermophila (strain SB210) TaxID=312017 RepID=Q22E52_TETTS|nr:glutathione S-transferase, amine-terminal domain protein [Tetrahymena thermophila SB210]EAR83562.1 glutathione S-transferase, amine-terminal domain protein [Tetrahymena thermophila SB210]|eukprot:XP_001031225.1 glutathione S-transferase, amine-terminal domain protein [Tetrahymena thermophila SB210]